MARCVIGWLRNTPPFNNNASGTKELICKASRAACSCNFKNPAICLLTAGSAAYGKPNSTTPLRFLSGNSSNFDNGKNPSNAITFTSSRDNVAARVPPNNFEPLANNVTLTDSGAFSANNFSFAWRHCSSNCDNSAADKRFSLFVKRDSSVCANAKSKLSPPNIK